MHIQYCSSEFLLEFLLYQRIDDPQRRKIENGLKFKCKGFVEHCIFCGGSFYLHTKVHKYNNITRHTQCKVDALLILTLTACPSGQRLQSHNGATCEDPDGEGPTVVGCHFDCPAGQLYSTTFKNCYRPENCPRCKAHASGDPHYTTFDGVYYTIFPQCSHIAAQDCLGGSWSVAHVTSNRCSGGRAPTCIDESILIVPRLGTRLHYRSVNNSYWFVGNVPSSDDLAVTLSGTYFTAHLREEDVTVLHQGTRLEVSTSVRWAGKMCGLFGTCDCNTTNEFVLRNGTVLTDFNDPRFLPEYNADEETGVCRVRPPPLPQGPTCAAPQPDAEAFCNVLRNTSGPYAACHSRYPPGSTYQLPVNSPFDQCVFDYCAVDQSSACADILAYATRCRSDGIAVGDPPAVCREFLIP